MSIQGNSKPISDILTIKRQYYIPRYQREYVWEEKQWKELYFDLKENYLQNKEDPSKESHFLGNIVILEEKKEFYTVAHVIDGQQRLTTIFLLLLAIMRKCNLTENKSQFSGIKKILKDTTTSGEEFDKFTNEDNPYFKNFLDTCTTYQEDLSNIVGNKDILKKRYQFEEKFIAQCFQYMFSQVSNDVDNGIIEIDKFTNRILQSIIIETVSTNIKEGYTVFEILNARGKPLKSHELIKNYVMRYYETENPDTALAEWKQLTEFLRKNKIQPQNFFEHYASHMYDRHVDKKNAFELVKENNRTNDTKALLEDFIKKADLYSLLHAPVENFPHNINNQYKSIGSNLMFFKRRGQTQFRPLFLSLFSRLYNNELDNSKRDADNDNRLADISLFLERFYFIFGVVLKEQPKPLEKVVLLRAYRIQHCDINDIDIEIEGLKSDLVNLLPDYETFKNAFMNLGYSTKNERYGEDEGNKKDVQYIIEHYEMFLRKNFDLVPEFTIEHIAKDTGEDKYCKIGNLMCLEEKLNNDGADKEVAVKVENYYHQSQFLSVKEFVDTFDKIFDEKEIIERGERIASILFEKTWIAKTAKISN